MTKRYKIPVISKSWGCKVQQDDQNLLYCIAYLKMAQRVNPKSYHRKKKKTVTKLELKKERLQQTIQKYKGL